MNSVLSWILCVAVTWLILGPLMRGTFSSWRPPLRGRWLLPKRFGNRPTRRDPDSSNKPGPARWRSR